MREGMAVSIPDARAQVARLPETGCLTAQVDGRPVTLNLALSERQAKLLLAGGLLNFTREEA